MSPEELAKIEARLHAVPRAPWVASDYVEPYTVYPTVGGGVDVPLVRCLDGGDAMLAFVLHAPGDIAALLSEVRRLTPAPKVAVWEAGVDDYEDCTVLRDPATGAVLGWCNPYDYGACIWELNLFPGAKSKIADLAVKNGWEVCDGE